MLSLFFSFDEVCVGGFVICMSARTHTHITWFPFLCISQSQFSSVHNFNFILWWPRDDEWISFPSHQSSVLMTVIVSYHTRSCVVHGFFLLLKLKHRTNNKCCDINKIYCFISPPNDKKLSFYHFFPSSFSCACLSSVAGLASFFLRRTVLDDDTVWK